MTQTTVDTWQAPAETESRAERATIGSILLDPEQFDLIAHLLTEQSFADHYCGVAWQAIRELRNKERPLDTLTVADQMAAIVRDDSGIAIWLLEVFDTVPHGMHAPEYAAMVREAWKRRQIATIGRDAIRRARDPHYDADDTLAGLEAAIRGVSADAGNAPESHIGSTILETLDAIGSSNRKRTPTGFDGLDGLIGGVRPGQFIVIGARPGMGKSAFALNVCDNIASAATAVGYVTLEMSQQELQERLLARRARVSLSDLECPGEAVRHALAEEANRIQHLPLILNESSRGLEEVVASIRTMKRKFGVEVVVVDYLGLVRPPDARAPREQQVAAISRRFKEIANEQQIAVVACCQLSRALEARMVKVPQLSDLR